MMRNACLACTSVCSNARNGSGVDRRGEALLDPGYPAMD